MQGRVFSQVTNHRKPPNGGFWFLANPFRLIVSPTKTWGELAQTANPAQAILAQFLLLAIGRLFAWQPMRDMIQSFGGVTQNSPLLLALFTELLLLAFFVVAANFALAGILFGCFSLLGMKLEFKRLLIWLSFGLIPICLGYLAGTIPLWFIQPLSADFAAALSWQIKPFSLGLASFFPGYFTPLSAQWFIASTFDFFGCWALWLLASGTNRYFQHDLRRSAWITCGLVLLFFVAASGMWQVFQAFLVYRG